MECQDAIDQLRHRLESSFGKALAMMILASASNETGVSTIGLCSEDFRRLAEAVGRDQRVLDMWGVAGAADATAEWRTLVA